MEMESQSPEDARVLTAADLEAFANGAPETRKVYVPAWKGVVLVRGLQGNEWDRHQAAQVGIQNGRQVANLSNVSAKLILPCLVNADGSRMFKDTAANVTMLGMLGIRELNKLGAVVVELSGMTDDEQAEIEGESEPAPSDEPSSE
jgi:hypothetical protein